MGHFAFRAPAAGRLALGNLRKRLKDPSVAESTARALEALDCELFLQDYEQAHAELRNDPEAWAEVEMERRSFDGTLMDGLERADD
jgi:hypothetical protein